MLCRCDALCQVRCGGPPTVPRYFSQLRLCTLPTHLRLQLCPADSQHPLGQYIYSTVGIVFVWTQTIVNKTLYLGQKRCTRGCRNDANSFRPKPLFAQNCELFIFAAVNCCWVLNLNVRVQGAENFRIHITMNMLT